MAAIHLPRTIRIGGGVLDELPEVLAAAGLSRHQPSRCSMP